MKVQTAIVMTKFTNPHCRNNRLHGLQSLKNKNYNQLDNKVRNLCQD
jgi:hypothetical protein